MTSTSPPLTLPPGQQVRAQFPRFGLNPYARKFPSEPCSRALRIRGDVAREIVIANPFEGLPRVEQTSDFHCVTTWTCQGLRWGGVRFADVYRQLIVPQAQPREGIRVVVLRGQDGYRVAIPPDDLLASDVLIADTLDSEPLSLDHGAPMRLVAPAHYGYKNVKHLDRIELWRDYRSYHPAGFRFMEHPRARVAHEERGQWIPGWILRYLYRPLIGTTVERFARASAEQRRGGQR